ncbi:MAG: tetratricopeptide repeat protein [Candidatus Moranbacteria bacterium]|nr:tetratricopeptide repeat protein [Candidatus Moranbacteria bacterium]
MTYLYFILPPVIIVITTALIFFLLSRKSFNLENKKEKVFEKKEEKKTIAMARDYTNIHAGFLSILERRVQWFKVVFLKLYNKIESWLGSIKKSKQIVLEKREENIARLEKISGEDKARVIEENIDLQEDLTPKKDQGGTRFRRKSGGIAKTSWRQRVDFSRSTRKIVTRKPAEEEVKKEDKKEFVSKPTEKEEKNSPMVSSEVVYPESKVQRERDDNLEKALVARIASDPRDIEAYEKLGAYYEERENYDDAMSCYKYVLKLNPRNKKAERKVVEIRIKLAQ